MTDRELWAVLFVVALMTACGRTTRHESDESQGTGGAAGGSSPSGGSATGGTSSASGGASEGGLGGAVGEPPTDATNLVGDWDVFMGEPPVIEGCTADVTERHITLWLAESEDGSLDARCAPDFGYPLEAEATVEGQLTLEETTWCPQLAFDLGAEGFTGGGEALVSYHCSNGAVTVPVPVQIAPDTTPVRSVIYGGFLEPFALPDDEWVLNYSEPVFLGDKRVTAFWSPKFLDPALVSSEVRAFDEAGNELELEHDTEAYVDAGLFYFVDPEAALGRRVRIENPRLTDHAGNPVDAIWLDVIDAGPKASSLDFENGPNPGIWGNVTYVPAGTPGSPCEAGACYVLEGNAARAEDATPNASVDAFLAARLAVGATGVDVRYRLWSAVPAEFGQSMAIGMYDAFDGRTVSSPMQYALETPDGPYTVASNWETFNLNLNYSISRGDYVFWVNHHELDSEEPVPYRLVIESVAAAPPY